MAISIASLFRPVQKVMDERAADADSRMFYFGLFIIIASLPYYFLNTKIIQPGQYDNLWLHALSILLCLILVLKNCWPKIIRPIFPTYLYLTLMYAMPFYITFLMLKNHISTAWFMNFISMIVLMMLIVDWFSYSILLIIGVSLAWITFSLSTPEGLIYVPGEVSYVDLINTIIPTLIMGIIFSYDKDKIQNEKLDAIRMSSANVAHELGTPLAAIQAGASVLKDYLPSLLKGYSLAKQNNLAVPNIYADQFGSLNKALDNIENEAKQANIVIEMLLTGVRQVSGNVSVAFSNCSISECINEALNRYPFFPADRKLINYESKDDFIFYGNKELTVHILFNLIKNALYYIKTARKGMIEIRIDKGVDYNYLHFKDTGSGMDEDTVKHLFNRFYSKTYHGNGIGLSYCKNVMRSYNGDIMCKSQKASYTEFILKFPVIEATV